MSASSALRAPAFQLTAVLLAALLLVAGCSKSSSADPDGLTKLRVAAPTTAVVGLSPELTGPAGWAIHEGKAKAVLAKYGYEYAGLAAFSNGPPAAQALASGSVQIAQIGDAPAVLSRGAGQSNRAILLADAPGMTWIVARKGDATSLVGLKGKKVGVQFGSDFDHYLRYALAKDGISNDVTLVNMVMADGYAALQHGSIDAYAAVSGIAAVWQQKGGVTVIEKASKANPSYEDASVSLVTQKYLTAHPNIQQAWWAVYQEGTALIKRDPAAFLAWTAKQAGESVAIATETTSLDFPTGPVTAKAVRAVTATTQVLVSQKLTKAFSVTDWSVQPSAGKSQ